MVPVFSPDGKRIAFSSNPTGLFNPYITDGPFREKLVTDMKLAGGYPTDWSPDGKNLLYWANEDLWIVPVGWQGETIRHCEDSLRRACRVLFTRRELGGILVERVGPL